MNRETYTGLEQDLDAALGQIQSAAAEECDLSRVVGDTAKACVAAGWFRRQAKAKISRVLEKYCCREEFGLLDDVIPGTECAQGGYERITSRGQEGGINCIWVHDGGQEILFLEYDDGYSAMQRLADLEDWFCR